MAQWQTAHKIKGEIRITHYLNPEDFKGELFLSLLTESNPEEVAVVRYQLAPYGEFPYGTFYVDHRETAPKFRRKKLMVLLNLYFFSRFNCQIATNKRVSDDGEAFFNGQKELGIFNRIFVNDEDPAIGYVNPAGVRKLTQDISTLFSQIETAL